MNTITTTLASDAPVLDLKSEAGFSLVDLAVLIPVIAIAAWYLYVKIWKHGGKCGGCGNKGCASRTTGGNAKSNEGVKITTLPPKAP